MDRLVAAIAVLAGFGACSGACSGPSNDAGIDIDNGSCGSELRFTGEYVDWDSDVGFCGILAAVVAVPGGAMATTAPNGRFDLCIPRANATTRLDVTQPAAPSQCASPSSGYSVPTMLFANRDVILAGGLFSGRAFTTERQATFFQGAGLQFDSNKAQVFVHVNGTPRAVSLTASHAPAQAVTATTWSGGDTGHDVFFPNVDIGGGTATLSVAGGAIGSGSIPLVAGTITNVSVIAH